MKFKIQNSKFKKVIFICGVWTVICCLIGCDAFVRKFTRKPKKEDLPREEMVLAPEEYKAPEMPKEDLYRQYYLFWKSWQDELILSLQEGRSQKKQMDCIEQAIENLKNLKTLLNQKSQEKLDNYINQEKELKNSISRDLYGNNIKNNISSAERIKRGISRVFSLNKIKDYLL
jgi:isochorismate hydrolase